MRILYMVHWLLPWLILALGIYTIVRFTRGYMSESAFTSAEGRLITVFTGLLDLQALLGFGYFIWNGSITGIFPAYRFGHGITMLIAVIIPHLSPLWKEADSSTRYINNFYLLLASFLFMLVGIDFIPG